MADPANPLGRFDLGFQEQVDFFRRKISLPTEKWTDIWQAAHDRSFVVAGAMKADLLDDLRRAVDKGIEQGTTLESFRDDFRQIVFNRGWTGWTGEGTTGGFNWRTKVIYETNLRTSYAAGREAQLADHGLQKLLPFRRYVHNDSVLHPRPQHLAWNGLTLPHDHPFWATHSPPNGWGCRCRVTAVAAPRKGDATKPPAGWDALDEKTGAPVGIDKGWGYAPGASVRDELRALVGAKVAKLPEPLGKALEKDMASMETPAKIAAREAAFRRLVPDYDVWVKEVRGILAKRGESDRGLSDAELVALHLYSHDRTMAHYTFINRALRGWGSGAKDDLKMLQPAIKTINVALGKLPAYTGTVKRGTTWLPDAEIAKYTAGKNVKFPEFLSTGKSKGFKGNFQYEFESKSGRDISFIANKPEEGEVLIPSGRNFHIVGVEKNGDVLTVRLKEK